MPEKEKLEKQEGGFGRKAVTEHISAVILIIWALIIGVGTFYWNFLSPEWISSKLGIGDLQVFIAKLIWAALLLLISTSVVIFREMQVRSSQIRKKLDKVDKMAVDLSNAVQLVFPEVVAEHFINTSRHLSQAIDNFQHDTRQCDVMKEHMRGLAESFAAQCEGLKNGEIKTDYDDCLLLSSHVNKLQSGEKLIGLTDWTDDEHWWGSDDASRFLEANRKAIAKGAKIVRVFVHDGDCADDSNQLPGDLKQAMNKHQPLKQEMDKQCGMGVDVHCIKKADLPKDCPQLSSQCVIKVKKRKRGGLEGWLTYRVERDGTGYPRWNIFYLNSSKIRENESVLERIIEKASKHCKPGEGVARRRRAARHRNLTAGEDGA